MGGGSRFRERHRRVRHSARWAGIGQAAGETAGELLRAATVPGDVIPRHAGAASRRDAICRPDGQGGREAYLRRGNDQQRRTAFEADHAKMKKESSVTGLMNKREFLAVGLGLGATHAARAAAPTETKEQH